MSSHHTKDLIIFDLDETLLDLHLDVEELRASIRPKFHAHGIEPILQPLYQGIAETTARLRPQNPTLAQSLEDDIWQSISDYEITCAQTRATPREHVHDLIQSLTGQHLAVYSNNYQASVEKALDHVGLGTQPFFKITGRSTNQSLKPSGQPVIDMIQYLGIESIDRIFFVGDSHYDALCVKNAQALLGSEKTIHFIALHPDITKLYDLEKLGASFIARDHVELKPLLTTKKTNLSLSVSVLAFNEEDSIAPLHQDALAFKDAYVDNLEVILIDDGSTDATQSMLKSLPHPELKLVSHDSNKGMGAAMASGYQASTKTFCVHLPADRQVRLQNLVVFLPHVQTSNIVWSTYDEPPSGKNRHVMSILFRWWVKYVGGLKKNFAGTYIFDRNLLSDISPRWKNFQTFVLSFVLLQEFSKRNKHFIHVSFRPFRRQFGSSKEATKKTIKKVLWEVLTYRF